MAPQTGIPSTQGTGTNKNKNHRGFRFSTSPAAQDRKRNVAHRGQSQRPHFPNLLQSSCDVAIIFSPKNIPTKFPGHRQFLIMGAQTLPKNLLANSRRLNLGSFPSSNCLRTSSGGIIPISPGPKGLSVGSTRAKVRTGRRAGLDSYRHTKREVLYFDLSAIHQHIALYINHRPTTLELALCLVTADARWCTREHEVVAARGRPTDN